MMHGEPNARLCPPNAPAISYTLLHHLGLMLDELSAQGLLVWQDERHAWRWAWRATELQAERGFWALGEAIVDAVVTRYPVAFDSTAVVSGVAYTWVVFGTYGSGRLLLDARNHGANLFRRCAN